MKITFEGQLKNLEDVNMEDGFISRQIGNILATEKSELDTVKSYILAQALYKNESIDVEKDTLEKIKKVVDGSASFPVFVKAQMIIAIDEQLAKYE